MEFVSDFFGSETVRTKKNHDAGIPVVVAD
jgi:hypothetical protein